MTPEITIIKAKIKHVYMLEKTLRDEDREEITCFGKAKKMIRDSFRHSIYSRTGFINGEIAAMWGLGGVYLGGSGEPWLLTSKIVEKFPLHFAKIYRREVKKMLTVFPLIENRVDAKYEKSVRMLELAGFNLDDPEYVCGGNFRRFWLVRQC